MLLAMFRLLPTSQESTCRRLRRATLAHHADELARSYFAVCEALLRIDHMRQRARSTDVDAPVSSLLSTAVAELVASGLPPEIDSSPRLLVFGFDAAQRDDSAWRAHRSRLEREFGLTVRAIGNPRSRPTADFG